MKKAKPTLKRPTKKELDAHVKKAMEAMRARMRVNGARLIAQAVHEVFAVDEKALAEEIAVLNCQTPRNKR